MSRANVRRVRDILESNEDMMPVAKRLEINAQIWEPTPPPKWLYFGCEGDSKPMAAITSRAWAAWHVARGLDPDNESRPPIPKTLRALVIERDGLICGICRISVAADDVHIDHIKPYSKGGLTVLGNLRVTHSRCNVRKGAREE